MDGAKLAHEAIDDPTRCAPAENIGQRGISCAIAFQCGAMHNAGIRFGAEQVCRADLHARSAKSQRCGNAVCIDDTARGDHRNIHRMHDLRQQREYTDLCIQILREEHAAMSAGLDTLRDDGVCTVLLKPEGFFDRGSRRQDFRAPAAPAREQFG